MLNLIPKPCNKTKVSVSSLGPRVKVEHVRRSGLETTKADNYKVSSNHLPLEKPPHPLILNILIVVYYNVQKRNNFVSRSGVV